WVAAESSPRSCLRTCCSASTAESTSGCCGESFPSKRAVLSCASTSPCLSRSRAGCEASSELGVASRAWGSRSAWERTSSSFSLDGEKVLRRGGGATNGVFEAAEVAQAGSDLRFERRELVGVALERLLGLGYSLAEFGDHAPSACVAERVGAFFEFGAETGNE